MLIRPPLLCASLCSFVAFAMPAVAASSCQGAGNTFSDVHGCESSFPAIEYLKEEAIVEGYSDNTFRPNGVITRAELTKILMAVKSTESERAACLSKTPSVFPDVPKGEWFAPYICIAKERGVVSGYPDGGFAPHAWINYAEAAKIAVNAYALPADLWVGDERWYAAYSYALLDKHAVPPTVEHYDSALTRGEMAEMIYRLETGKTSMEWFASLGDDTVLSTDVSGVLRDVSFSFPGSSFSAHEAPLQMRDIFAQGGNVAAHGLSISHVEPDEEGEGCNGMAGLGDYCRPSMSRLSITAGIVDRPMEYLKLGANAFDVEEVGMVASRQTYAFWEGVECEGVKTVFVPVDATRSLIIRRTFDCNDQEGMLSAAEQDALFGTFLSSIRIAMPPVAQPAPTMNLTLVLCSSDVEFNAPDASNPKVPFTRIAPKSTSVADMTLRALFEEWGDPEKGARACIGVSSLRDDYRGVVIANGVATVTLARPFAEIFSYPGEEYSVSAQRSVTANLKQFPSVQTVRYVVQP